MNFKLAMSFEAESEKEKLDMFVNAFQKTGCRAIIQGFQKTLKDYKSKKNWNTAIVYRGNATASL